MADIEVLVCYSPGPRQWRELPVLVSEGATVEQALLAAGLGNASAKAAVVRDSFVGVWNKRVLAEHRLRAGDRVEIYRALLVDPKVARQQRFAQQGARATGLFKKRRAGAKPGY